MTKPGKIEGQFLEIASGLNAGRAPAWLGAFTASSLHPILTEAALFIAVSRALQADLDQANQLNGRLLRRLSGETAERDINFIEALLRSTDA
jgi:hypothetical protein